MKILVTGAAGYIGDAVVEMLLAGGHEVVALDSLLYGGAYLRRHANLKFVRGDIRDCSLVESLIAECDSVVHLAAIVGDGACHADHKLTVDVNQKATEHIAALCMIYDRRLVFASTCSVYGAAKDLLDEDSPTNPLSLYAGTKLLAEDYVKGVNNHVIFRLGTLFGLSSPHARLRCDLVANILTYKAMLDETITVFGGDQWRPLLHVRDAASNMALAAVRDEHRGTFILNHKNYKIIDLANIILDVCEKPGNIEITELPYEDQRNYKISDYYRGSVWHTPISLKDGVFDMAQAMKEGRIADVWNISYHNAKYVKDLVNEAKRS